MIRPACFLFVLETILISGSSAAFFPASDRDSVQSPQNVYTLREVVITATRNETSLNSVPSPVSVISQSQIEIKPGSLLADALTGTPGILTRPYGGANALHTVSLRGMGPEHTVVLLDGERFSTGQNGLSDISLFPTADLERVEIVRGGYSSLYGADAIGGVVNLLTKQPSDEIGISFLNTIGSASYEAHEFSLSGSLDNVGWQTMVRRERGSGHYEFQLSDGKATSTMRRTGEDFNLLSASGRFQYVLAEHLRARLSLSYTGADRGSPDPLSGMNADGVARLGDDLGHANLALEWTFSAAMSALLHSSFQYSHETYNDPRLAIFGIPAQSYSTNRAFSLRPEVRLLPSAAWAATIGLEFSRDRIESSDVSESIRWQRSLFLLGQHTISLEGKIPFEVVLFPSLRYDSFSDVDGDLSPKLGVNLGLLKYPDLRIRASYGKSFRAPTFNDLYWKAGGNPLLKPERSRSFDCGTVATLPMMGSLRLDVSYFSIQTKDRIVWTPDVSGLWTPKNILDVTSDGFEAEGSWTGFDGLLAVTLNSTWTDARKRSGDFPGDPTEGKKLVYIPKQTLNASVSIRSGPAELYLQHSWVAGRYTTDLNDQSLPGYSTTSASVKYSVQVHPIKTFLKIEATNLFNSSYQVISLYPVPLREFRGTFGVLL